MAENVRVAVRVRPFNSREKTRNSTLIIKMLGNNTEIKDPSMPEAEPKKFAFDFSYWSHDSFEEDDKGYLHPTDPKYADQEIVFKDLGQGVLDNAWKGFNCSLFAYGQTGSGKSYSMVGYGANKGVIPIFCDTLFKEIDEKKASGTVAEYQVALSMLEIYNEQVRDLLNPASNKKGGLKVRQHPNKGFYVESLVTVPVKSYADIDNKIEEGTRSRTVAATNMNATSSRAHTIVAITFIQKAKNEAGQNMTKTSVINLVDLAGSERAESTGATGDRLKEGSAINQSLSMLGNCIKALADQSTGKKGVLVPFRDSVLTKLLKNALGGNSKTIMIAALSPADINYEETLSTLRFADRAKAIKTKAIINESPTDKLIRELREENARLMEEIKKGGVVYVQGEAVPAEQQGPGGPSEEEVEEMKREMEEQLKRNQDEMEQMKKSWQERLQETEATYKAKEEEEKKEKEMRKTTPHFWNLNEDPQLSNMIVHFIKPGTQKLGNRKADPPAQITLSGLSILPDHASITCKQNAIKIRPTQDAKLLVNGKPCTEETALHHNDRVMFGSSNLFVLHHPAELDQANKSGQLVEKVTFDMAQEEIAQNSGFNMDKTGGKSKDELLLQDDLVQLVPMVNESNAMAEELGKKVKFELMLISPQARGLKEGRTEVKVKMKSKDDDAEWVWDRNKFFNRKYLMQEMYQNFVEGEDWEKSQDNDPFWEPDDTDVMIGSAQVYLQSLAYKIELEENLAITDHRGADMGHLQVEIYPCDSKGNEDIDDFVEEPSELIGKELIFNLKIPAARGLPQRFSKGKTYCSYKLYLDKESSLTQIISNTINPDFGYIKRFAFSPVTKQFLDYLVNQPLIIEVWGKQVGRKVSKVQAPTKPSVQKPNAAPQLNVQTKRNVEIIHRSYSSNVAAQPQPSQQTANTESIPRSHSLTNDDRKHQLQLTKSIRRADRSDKKLKKIRELVEEAKKNKTTTLEVSVLEGILNGGEGDKFKATASVVMTTNKAAAENDGKITSSACVLQ